MSQLVARLKAHKSSLMIGGATLVCALGIGYVMQYKVGASDRAAPQHEVLADLDVTGVTPTSSAATVTFLPGDAPAMPALPGPRLETASYSDAPVATPDLPQTEATPGFACDIALEATPTAGALVSLALTAPCHASERVTLHHQGLMFTEVLQPDGTLTVKVPALAQQALFIADFASGAGATATAEVTSLPFYDRVALQWKGDSGLQLHAREFGAAYFSDGHIWANTPGTLTAAARGEGGFLTRLGNPDTPDALLAEVYSFPTGTATRSGDVALSIEAEITAQSCGRSVEAQTMEVRSETRLRTRTLTLEIPGCETQGDFLVLKNLVEDLTIAAR
jgi:hypothetical protein